MMAGGGRMQEINVTLIFVIGLISALLLVVLVLGAHAWMRYEQQSLHDDRVYGVGFPEHERLVEPQRERIETFRWVDEEQQRAAIPIDRAIDRVVEQYPQPRSNP